MKQKTTTIPPHELAEKLRARRDSVGRYMGIPFAQPLAAKLIGVSLGSYQLAERHGVIRGSVRAKIIAYLSMKESDVRSAVERMRA